MENVLDGTFEEYHENGVLKLQGEYRDGDKEGNWIEYSETGEVLKEEKY